MTRRGPVTPMFTKFVFTRPTSLVAFVSLFTLLLGNFFFSYLHLALAQLMPNSRQIVVSCMVVWMSANDGDIIRKDESLHFYRLRKSKDLGYYEFKP